MRSRPPLLNIVGRQLRIEPDIWPQYAQRPETRREHLLELQAWLKLTPFAVADYRRFVHQLAELAQQTDRGIVLAEALVELLRQQRIILPAVDVIERVCSEALTRAARARSMKRSPRRSAISTAVRLTACWRSARAPRAAG
jgi:hypothetical protein